MSPGRVIVCPELHPTRGLAKWRPAWGTQSQRSCLTPQLFPRVYISRVSDQTKTNSSGVWALEGCSSGENFRWKISAFKPTAHEQIFGVTSNSSLYRGDMGELWLLGAALAEGETGWERWCCREYLQLR